MQKQKRHTTKNVRDSQGRPYHSRRCFLRHIALSECRQAKPPVYKVDLVCCERYVTH